MAWLSSDEVWNLRWWHRIYKICWKVQVDLLGYGCKYFVALISPRTVRLGSWSDPAIKVPLVCKWLFPPNVWKLLHRSLIVAESSILLFCHCRDPNFLMTLLKTWLSLSFREQREHHGILVFEQIILVSVLFWCLRSAYSNSIDLTLRWSWNDWNLVHYSRLA